MIEREILSGETDERIMAEEQTSYVLIYQGKTIYLQQVSVTLRGDNIFFSHNYIMLVFNYRKKMARHHLNQMHRDINGDCSLYSKDLSGSDFLITLFISHVTETKTYEYIAII